MSDIPEYLMTVDEVAALLRTCPSTVRYWRYAGYGPRSFKVGRRVLYARSDVLAFIDAAQREGSAIRPPCADRWHPSTDRPED